MSVSAVGGSSAAFDQTYAVSVARKALSATKLDGQNALQLIEAAKAPPVKPGHSLSVIA